MISSFWSTFLKPDGPLGCPSPLHGSPFHCRMWLSEYKINTWFASYQVQSYCRKIGEGGWKVNSTPCPMFHLKKLPFAIQTFALAVLVLQHLDWSGLQLQDSCHLCHQQCGRGSRASLHWAQTPSRGSSRGLPTLTHGRVRKTLKP